MDMIETAPGLRDLVTAPLTADAFAAYGAVAEAVDDMMPPSPADAALDLSGGRPRFYVMRLPPRGDLIRGITRHRAVTQVLAAVGGRPWMLAVAPPDGLADDAATPDPAGLRAFTIPGNVAVVLHRGTWHAGPYFDGPEMDFFNLELADTNRTDHQNFSFVQSWGHAFRLRDGTAAG